MTRLIASILQVYFLIAMLAIPYLNWQYAKQHGFTSWLLFGEVVATAKAAAWPYYAVASESDTIKGGDHFQNATALTRAAMATLDKFDNFSDIPKQEIADIVNGLRLAVTEAELVDDSFLQHDKLPSGYLRQYRDNYTAGIQELADGLQSGSQMEMVAAFVKMSNFQTWVTANL